MPLKGLRTNRSERDLKRRSTLDPTGLFKLRTDRTEQHPEQLAPARFAVSEDGGRPRASDVSNRSAQDELPPSPPVQEHTPNTRRFSLMRFRHASDSQLSLKAREHAAEVPPPVPQLPVATPAIITTAPTVAEHEEAVPRKRGRMQQFNLRRRSFEPNTSERPALLRKSMDKAPKNSTDLKRHPFSFMKSRDALAEEPRQLSTTQCPETLAPPVRAASDSCQEGTSSLSLPVPRQSESSRSDESSGGHVSFEHNPRPRHPPKTGSARFVFGRRNKQRASLFPLPAKVEHPHSNSSTAPGTPRISTSGVSSGSPPRHSPTRDQGTENGTDMPSSSQVVLAAASMNLASPASGLLRNDSTRSVRSAQSSPNNSPIRLALRGRSSTMGSLGGRAENAPSPTPPQYPSGRNSTSTAGRTSFSNLFGLSARFRQNSEPYSPRNGSPSHGFVGTPGFLSQNISREALVVPEREEGETAGRYLERLEANNADRSAIAGYLTKTGDPFLQAVLRSYMRKFAFYGDPIDMALRKLLMQVELPKETQQIDRVIQGFADRYHECNPGIYVSAEQAYFVSFSIVILHTDFFNKNNKRKMQRNDYIKNVSSEGEGVSPDVLGCFYDNTVYTQFIKIEDDFDLKNIASRKTKRTAVLKGPLADPARKTAREPVDPYQLILEGKLDVLRPNIKDVMNLDDPYTYLGTAPTLDIRNLYKSFSRYGVIQIVSSRSRPEAYMSQNSEGNPLDSSVGIVEMPVTKVGILWRKDTKRKKARSPWQEWGAVLTRSGLSLFRSSSWAKHLMHQHEQHQKQGNGGAVVFQPPVPEFKPEQMIPMDGAVALVDTTYKKHKNAFVMFSRNGEETFLADSEKDLNDWLGMLNYSAAFQTLGVRPRGMIGGLYEGQRNRGIRRLESSHSTRSVTTATGEVTIQSGKIDKQLAEDMMNARKELMQVRISESEETLTTSIRELELRLRDARHLQILAPIQPKTRELVIHAAGRLSAKLKWARIEIWRMKCHRDILAQELEDERQNTNGRQARVERIDESAQSLQPQPMPSVSHKSKISGLARLSSKASSLTGGHKPPSSPTTSLVRPGTKSSRETDPDGEEAFKTPPETRQTSPNHPSAQFGFAQPFSPQSGNQLSNRRPSMTSLVAHSPRLAPKDHRPSVSTMGDTVLTSDVASDRSHYTTPPPTDEPRTPELAPADGPRIDVGTDSESEQRPAGLAGSPTSRSKVRRSLQRTLRDSHVGSSHSHRRSHKGRDSASTIVSNDTQESEGLARGQGSFTVHGKKASVITFGLDWNNMPAEERLKSRKQVQEYLEGAGSDEKDANTDDRARSITSTSTATLDLNAPMPTEPDETTPRQSSSETRKQRHVSSQTITPANFQNPLNGHESDSEMSEIEEESSPKDVENAKDAALDSNGVDHIQHHDFAGDDSTKQEDSEEQVVQEEKHAAKPQLVEA